MNNTKYFPVVHPSERYMDIKNAINQNIDKVDYLTSDINKANLILVLGGDWYMLEMIKKYADAKKPFLWVNCGTLWFLMNDISTINDIPKSFDEINIRNTKFIKAEIEFVNWEKKIAYAANDICIGNSVLDYYTFDVKHWLHESVESDNINNINIKWTGLVISNNFGSTSYRLSLGGPLIPTSSNLLGIIGIWALPYRFKMFKPQNIKINISWKSDCLAGFDGYSGKYENIKTINIMEPDLWYDMAFLKSQPIETKRILMAEAKIWYN